MFVGLLHDNFPPKLGGFGVLYYYTSNSIEVINHCEEHASENIRCTPAVGVPMTIAYFGVNVID